MPPLLRLAACGLLCPALLIAADGPEADGVTPDHGVTPEQEIKFQQDRAEGHMRELEQRMFKLARMIREAEPDDSARLLMGLQKAREELIADRMREAGDRLLDLKLEAASSDAGAIVESLEELRRMMLSADIDLEIKLEQLKKLREARRKLAKLIDAETEQKAATERRESEAGEKKSDDLAKQERRNERLNEDILAAAKKLGRPCEGACESLASAGGKMSAAAKKLDLIKLPPAKIKQGEAVDELTKADLKLAEAEAKMKADLEKFVLKRVLETLDEMIARQEAVREATQRLQDRAASGDQRALAAVRGLEEGEAELIAMAETCLELGELVDLSMVLPLAMESIMDQIDVVCDQLAEGRADEAVVAGEAQIEEDLKMVYDALRKSARTQKGQSQCKNCGNCRNKLLAEFKMLRFLQISLQKQTARADADLASRNAGDAERSKRARPLGDRQRDIQRTTLRLHDANCQECLGG